MTRYLALLASLLLLAAVPKPTYRIDLTHYFSTAAAEASSRAALAKRVQTFAREGATMPRSPAALEGLLAASNALFVDLQRHDIYLYLKSEENVDDDADANADGQISSLEDAVSDRLDQTLAITGKSRLYRFLHAAPQLERYRYMIETSLERSAHALDAHDARLAELVADPALDAATESYRALRRRVLASAATPAGASQQAAFRAKWAPYVAHQDAFAALLVPVVALRNGLAKLHGFANAPARAYNDQMLTSASVERTLAAVRDSSAERDYYAVLAAAAARQLNIPLSSLHPWDIDAADTYEPAPIPIREAIALILAAEQPMGGAYASAYAQLLEPAHHRLDICVDPKCDAVGFSVGFSGSQSGAFFGDYRGTTDSVRAVAHESGHAVHREFMNEHQPIAAYNAGPSFMFESFAIFNELLFYDHMYKRAAGEPERAYYLKKFLDDATFQIYGSAEETDLEAHIYRASETGQPQSAADLNALTARVFARYAPRSVSDPDSQLYWARDSLYFTDPLYDVSYLYAGLLALKYFDAYDRDARTFSTHYVALLEHGFTAPPAALEKHFLGIDLNDEASLVRSASALIERRSAVLAKLYAVPEK